MIEIILNHRERINCEILMPPLAELKQLLK